MADEASPNERLTVMYEGEKLVWVTVMEYYLAELALKSSIIET